MANKHLKKSDTAPDGTHQAPEETSDAPAAGGGLLGFLKAARAQDPFAGGNAPEPEQPAPGEKAPAHAAPKEKASAHAAPEEKAPAHAAPAHEAPAKKKKAAGEKHAKDDKKPAEKDAAGKGKKAPKTKAKKSVGKDVDSAPEQTAKKSKKPVTFRRDRVPAEKDNAQLSQRDAVGALIALVAAMVLFAATLVIWIYRDSFSPDNMILSADSAAVATDEYVFDAGDGF